MVVNCERSVTKRGTHFSDCSQTVDEVVTKCERNAYEMVRNGGNLLLELVSNCKGKGLKCGRNGKEKVGQWSRK